MALLGNRDGSDQSAHFRNLIRLFFEYHQRWMYKPRAHTGLQKKENSNLMWRGIILRKYPYIKLYLSVSNIYIASSIKTPSLEQLIFFYSKSMWFQSLMNVLLNSYHAIPSLNHSLLDFRLNSFHSKVCRIEINQFNQAFTLIYEFRNSEFRIRNSDL